MHPPQPGAIRARLRLGGGRNSEEQARTYYLAMAIDARARYLSISSLNACVKRKSAYAA
jgi:hypothetical protein